MLIKNDEKFVYEDYLIKFSMPIITPVMLIQGDTATGKTYLLKRLKLAQKNFSVVSDEISCNYDLSKFYVVLTKDELESVYKYTNSIIFIDRFDIFADKRLIDFINTGTNIFVLMYRNTVFGIPVTVNSYLDLWCKEEGNKFIFEAI